MPLLLQNAQQTLEMEPDCHQFDVCRPTAGGNEVLLYEIYAGKAAFEAHLTMPHFKEFDAAVAAMIDRKTVRTYEGVTQ